MTVVFTATLVVSGLATRYDPGVMAEVAANRIAWGQLPPDVERGELIAVTDCDYIGADLWLAVDGTWVPVTVADCAQAQHAAAQRERGWAVDLNYSLALELGAVDGPLDGVQVWDGLLPPLSNGVAAD